MHDLMLQRLHNYIFILMPLCVCWECCLCRFPVTLYFCNIWKLLVWNHYFRMMYICGFFVYEWSHVIHTLKYFSVFYCLSKMHNQSRILVNSLIADCTAGLVIKKVKPQFPLEQHTQLYMWFYTYSILTSVHK